MYGYDVLGWRGYKLMAETRAPVHLHSDEVEFVPQNGSERFGACMGQPSVTR
jgi:hypothetical protein